MQRMNLLHTCRAGRLYQVFLKGVPVVALPTGVEGVVFACGEGGVVEDEGGFGGVGFEFEMDDGVDAGIPVGGAPGLDDSLVGDQFDGATYDFTAEH